MAQRPPPEPPTLALVDVAKSFGAVHALRGLSMDLRPGRIHALVGENGAGKSTVVKTIAGVHAPDAGHVEIDGARVELTSPADAQNAGVAVIYQEPTLFPDLSVAENIFMGRQPLARGRRIDYATMRTRTEELFARLGVRIDPDRPASGLSIADQQLIEIAKALSRDARVLVMDEPTAALSGVEVERLFAVTRSLRDNGAAILFISHRFTEIFALSDELTIMRDGAFVAHAPTAELDTDTVVRRMVGREVTTLFPKQEVAPGEVLLEIDGLTRAKAFGDVSFSVRAGEIVALAGLVGAGRSEVVRAVFGVDRYDSGTVRVAGQALPRGRPAAAMRAGLALVPEDRRQQGLVMDLSVERNATLTRRWALSRLGLLTRSAERAATRTWAERLRVKAARLSDAVATLSGGNQQKLVLAKWLATGPRVLLIDEPTRGIDVGTKAEVHRLLSELAADGMAVVMVSSELPEVLGMADRVLVMHEGRMTAELPRAEASEESVMYAATGQHEAVA
ncbi:rhamnose transport system ATP-binding protein [Lipingzhangella halophila]|uniref:Rhamnose transport system ATP-binding protein n=1 Tax=Lipingzhangella halophila TaxID=1783352 RepID=A0A7W7RMU9_9ACTN|nr:sugar ABC transporter ATP-binding protein [Lipingzhangella halophila]MBB4934899.1 rhamnose transport system ATP-binding protein [Lipingzhangella halophila]